MKTKLLIVLAILAMFYGCKKDTYTTKPQIKLKNTYAKSLTQGDLLLFEVEFTDKEGDIQDTLFIQKFSKVCPTQTGVTFLSKNNIPNFTPTSNLDGVLEVGYSYNTNIQGYQRMIGCSNRTDTAYFRFWLKDKAQHTSDTITSENIVLLR